MSTNGKGRQRSTVTVDDLAKEVLPSHTEELAAEVRLVRVTSRKGTKFLAEAKFRAERRVVGTIALIASITVVIEIVTQVLRQ